MLLRRRLLIALLVLTVGLSLAFYFTPLKTLWNPPAAANWLRSAGDVWWVPLAYIGFYLVFTLLLVPPVILSTAAALMWGWFAGGLVELFAATLAAFPPYFLARWSGGEWLRRQLERRRSGSYDRLEREGFFAVLLFRLVPVIPYVVLNYLAGLASVRSGKYLTATFVGMIPSIFIFTYFVDAIASSAADLRRALPRIFLAGIALAILAIATRVAVRRLQ